MGIQYHCQNPACGKLIAFAERPVGRQIKCPECGSVMRVPGEKEIEATSGRDQAIMESYQQFLRKETGKQAKADETQKIDHFAQDSDGVELADESKPKPSATRPKIQPPTPGAGEIPLSAEEPPARKSGIYVSPSDGVELADDKPLSSAPMGKGKSGVAKAISGDSAIRKAASQRSGQRPAIQPGRVAPAVKMLTCPGCNRQIPVDKGPCPFCEYIPMINPVVAASEVGMFLRPAPVHGSYFKLCRSALANPGANAGSIFLATMSLAVWYLYYKFFFIYLPDYFPNLMSTIRQGRWWLLAAGTPMIVILGGFCLQVAMRLISGSVAGATKLVSGHRFQLPQIVKAGLMGITLVMIYVVPIITLPLLPLALLAMSMTNDARAFNVSWALRWASACGELFATLWLILLGSIAAFIGVIYVLGVLFGWAGELVLQTMGGAEGRIISEMVIFAGVVVTIVICCVLACGPIRCIGLLGRFRTDMLDTLAGAGNKAVTAAAIVGGFLAAILLMLAIL